MANSIKKKPVFVLDYSVYDTAIGRHYEASSKPAKDLLYELTTLKAGQGLCIAVISPALANAVQTAFGQRKALSFLFDYAATIESHPLMPLAADLKSNHAFSTVILAIWKHIANPDRTYLVTEDPSLKDLLKLLTKQLKISPNVIGYKQAYDILTELDLNCVSN